MATSPIFAAAFDPRVYLNALNTLETPYVQDLWTAEGERLHHSEGRMSLSIHPLRLCIEEQRPSVLKMVFDGERLWQYDAELAQVTRYPKHQLGDAPLLALFDKPHWQQWHLEKSHQCRVSKDCYQLTPDQPSEVFQRIRLGFKADQLQELQVILPTQERNVYVFQSARLNQAIARHQFQFQVPEGVDLIESELGG